MKEKKQPCDSCKEEQFDKIGAADYAIEAISECIRNEQEFTAEEKIEIYEEFITHLKVSLTTMFPNSENLIDEEFKRLYVLSEAIVNIEKRLGIVECANCGKRINNFFDCNYLRF